MAGTREFGGFFDDLGIEELARRQGVPIPKSLDELRGDWLDDEPIQEFLDRLRGARQ